MIIHIYIYIHGLGVCNAFIYACFVHTYIHKYEYILFIGMMVGASTHIQNHMFEDGDGPILPAQALEPEEEKVIFRVLYSNPSKQKLLHITPNAGRFLPTDMLGSVHPIVKDRDDHGQLHVDFKPEARFEGTVVCF